MREKTNVYFLAEITRGYGNGDCILLENIDTNGKVTHALIDTGRRVNKGAVCRFLEKHKVKELAFLCITHSHGDHNGDTISVLENFKVNKLIMKEFDRNWCPDGTQGMYEKILKNAIEKNIKVLGVSFESLGSSEYSPSQSEDFKATAKKAKKENFEFMNEGNTDFKFGSAYIIIMNWEIFDSEGNLFVPGKNIKNGKKLYRDKYAWENKNSLGILLIQGEKKAFFSGDMNNMKKNVLGKQIGDEDRLKNQIGRIDLLKLGHHGYQSSNTNDYINVLFPKYCIITNDIGREYYEIKEFMDRNKVNYLYSTQDEYEVNAVIYNDAVTLGFGTSGIKKVKEEIFYIPENKIYANYLKSKFEVKYKTVEKSVNNWDELKNLIEQNRKEGTFNETEKFYTKISLKINLINNDNNVYNANSSIVINKFQKIQLITNSNEIIIKRDNSLVKYPLFKVENGFLTLGQQNMSGKIILDGNKENVASTSHLVELIGSQFNMYNNVILRNNLYRISKRTKDPSDFGSALFAINKSKINMFGGEISNNIQEVFLDKNNNGSNLPENMEKTYFFDIRGVGIYLGNSSLNMKDGKICNNQGINNSDIYTNKNSTNNNNHIETSLTQRCSGVGICAEGSSEIFLHKGEISKNFAKNNSKLNFITPVNGKITKMKDTINNIYGSAIYALNTKIEIYDGFIIQNNSSQLNTTINIQKNCEVKGNINSTIIGGQIYFNHCNIKIQGGIIQNSNNTNIVNSKIATMDGKNKTVITETTGGGIYFVNCQNMVISNLKVIKCSAKNGGGIYLAKSTGKISNSEFKSNTAVGFGGAIYMKDKNCSLELYNSKVLNNSAKEGSGGGIYAFGTLVIDGVNSSISNNIAETYGGGIMTKTTCTIKNGTINNNKALKNSGGGIRADGNLVLNRGKIYGNWCNENGGGVNAEHSKVFLYNKKKVGTMVYNNIAIKKGNNIYPEKK